MVMLDIVLFFVAAGLGARGMLGPAASRSFLAIGGRGGCGPHEKEKEEQDFCVQ
jgi:hypothetical protein